MKLLLMGCSATKRTDPQPMRAIDRYDGPMWQSLRARLAELPLARAALLSGNLKIIVLSAGHGFINANDKIADYDQRLTPMLAAKMAPELSFYFHQRPSFLAPADAILFAGGAVYRRAMRVALSLHDDARVSETDGAGIGLHRAQLGAWLTRHFAAPLAIAEQAKWPALIDLSIPKKAQPVWIGADFAEGSGLESFSQHFDSTRHEQSLTFKNQMFGGW